MPNPIETGGKKNPTQQQRLTARLQLLVKPEVVPGIFAASARQPQVELYNRGFPEPFTNLSYSVLGSQHEVTFVAILGVGPDFNRRYADSIGSDTDLAHTLLRRYPESKFQSPQSLVVYKDSRPHALITRPQDEDGKRDKIIIQMGGQTGKLSLSEENPINDLSRHLIDFNLLIGRYVSSIWKASEETNQQMLQLTISLPALPEGAIDTLFSTFSFVGKEFRGRPRPVDLDREIGGYPQLKAEIKSLITSMTNPDTIRSFGRQPFSNKFILVTGGEGTGKSLFPKAIDTMLRDRFAKYEDYHLPLSDILTRYGNYSATVIATVLDHIRENEKRKIPTLLHIDNLEELVAPNQRITVNGTQSLLESQGSIRMVSAAELQSYIQTTCPVVETLRQFGIDLGGESHHIIAYGESRASRDFLPEGVARTFRRSFSLDKPTQQDLKDILRVQIAMTRKFAAPTKYDPFQSGIEFKLDEIARSALGLVGRDLQQALMDITTRKISFHTEGSGRSPVTAGEMIEEIRATLQKKGIESAIKRRPLGFKLPHREQD